LKARPRLFGLRYGVFGLSGGVGALEAEAGEMLKGKLGGLFGGKT
jgi:hypothetical protein